MERKKIINICHSFSAVTNINSWRVKSALSYVVSLDHTQHSLKIIFSGNSCSGKFQAKLKDGPFRTPTLFIRPDRTFRNFRASKSADRRFWTPKKPCQTFPGQTYRHFFFHRITTFGKPFFSTPLSVSCCFLFPFENLEKKKNGLVNKERTIGFLDHPSYFLSARRSVLRFKSFKIHWFEFLDGFFFRSANYSPVLSSKICHTTFLKCLHPISSMHGFWGSWIMKGPVGLLVAGARTHDPFLCRWAILLLPRPTLSQFRSFQIRLTALRYK